jgi:hypothetical protein
MWQKAFDDCARRNMKLLSIETEEESNCIYELKTIYGKQIFF